MKAGVIGLGDMGSGIAKNLIKNGFTTYGFDLDESRLQAFTDGGGQGLGNAMAVGEQADAVFIMVMSGDQVNSVIFGEQGLLQTMKPGSVIILSATINPAEATSIGQRLDGSGIFFIDTPVSGGFPGAQNGTLTLMAAAPADLLQTFSPVLEAVSANIHHVGTEPGMGQTVKACLQSLIGSVFSATYEASVLAAKAGVSGQALYDVFSTSAASSGITNSSLEYIIDRKFEGTGSHIATMHKDLTISLAMAQDLGVPLHTASTAMQLFHAGKTKYPDSDNQVVTRVIEEIVGAQLHRKSKPG